MSTDRRFREVKGTQPVSGAAGTDAHSYGLSESIDGPSFKVTPTARETVEPHQTPTPEARCPGVFRAVACPSPASRSTAPPWPPLDSVCSGDIEGNRPRNRQTGCHVQVQSWWGQGLAGGWGGQGAGARSPLTPPCPSECRAFLAEGAEQTVGPAPVVTHDSQRPDPLYQGR